MQKKRFAFDKKNIFVLLALAWPAIAEQLMQTAVNYVDAAMVGSLGAGATAAVAINSPPFWLVTGVFQGFGIGFSVQVAQAIGANDTEKTRKIVRQAVLATLLFGVGLLLISLTFVRKLPVWMGAEAAIVKDASDYIFALSLSLPFMAFQAVFATILRCMGDTRTPLFIGILSNLINIVFNTLLIFQTRVVSFLGFTFTMPGAGLGVAGAAIATSISIVVAGSLLVMIIYRRRGPYRVYLKESYRPDVPILKRALRLGVPVALDRVILSTGQMVMTRLVSSLGTLSLAANHVAVTAEAICYLPAQGVSFSATALVGQRVGANDLKEAKSFGMLSGVTGFIMMAVAALGLFLFAKPLSSIFSPDPEVVELAADMLRIVAIAEPFLGLNIVMAGALRGANDTRWPFYISAMGMWGVRMAFAFTLVYAFDFGLSAVWIAMAIDLWFRGITTTLRFKRGKWLIPLQKTEAV
ncbi:MATE family efflux transporter [Christensenellaceae bacterium OttesenSCG-928-M15]|nr:MATE family efflux transporter [Christensenellaceae bacterium OttesenSCG-928-M15]